MRELPQTPDLEIPDPLWQRLELPASAMVYPLGCPVEIQSNTEEVVEAARASWQSFPQLFNGPPVRLRVIVSPDVEPAGLTAPSFRAQRHLLSIVLDAANFAVCDLRCGFGFACLSASAVADRDYLRWFFLEAMAYSILTTLYFTPIHAGSVALDGRGVLLCGASGAGKTTLTYACARQGFSYTGDDVASLARREETCRVIGKPFQFRFRDTAPDLFPELRIYQPAAALHGKPSIEVATHRLAGVRTAVTCEVAYLVFLNRGGSGAARLVALQPDEAQRRLRAGMPIVEPEAWKEQCASLARLAARPAFELRYSDLDRAVSRLERLLADGR